MHLTFGVDKGQLNDTRRPNSGYAIPSMFDPSLKQLYVDSVGP